MLLCVVCRQLLSFRQWFVAEGSDFLTLGVRCIKKAVWENLRYLLGGTSLISCICHYPFIFFLNNRSKLFYVFSVVLYYLIFIDRTYQDYSKYHFVNCDVFHHLHYSVSLWVSLNHLLCCSAYPVCLSFWCLQLDM